MTRIRSLATVAGIALVVGGGAVVGGGPAVAATPSPASGQCVAAKTATRTVGTIRRVSPSRIAVNGRVDYWNPPRGWTPLPPKTYRITVQKQRADGSWANVTSVTPQKTWRVSGTAGVYRLAYLRACNRPYAASSGRAVLVGRPAVTPRPVVTTPQPVVTTPQPPRPVVATPPSPRPVVTTPPSNGSGGPYYPNCAAARAAGAAPLHRGEPGYRPELDGDSDGVACE